MIPYDPTRQKYTNDFSQADIERDKEWREMVAQNERIRATHDPKFAAKIEERDRLAFDQRRDRKQMAAEDVAKARDLIHAYGDARVNAALTAWEAKKEVYAAKAADAFAKLMILVAELAKGAYE